MQYLVYDTAINGLYTLSVLQELYPAHQSLFKKTKDESLLEVAPFIFRMDQPFPETIGHNEAISLKAVIVLESEKTLEVICDHFREFIYQKVKGRTYYFRFWDARVIHQFLPTCEEWQLRSFLSPIKTLSISADDSGNIIQYQHIKYQLSSIVIPGKAISRVFDTMHAPESAG